MKTKNLVAWAVWIALLAALIQLIDQQLAGKAIFLAGGAWVAFQAWAVYFLGGSNVRGGVKGLLAYVVGITTGVVIFELAAAFGLSNWWAVPLAIFLPVIPVMCLQEVDLLSYIPAIFLGCGAFFGILNYAAPVHPLTVSGADRWQIYAESAGYELFFCVLGLLFGWIAISGKAALVDRLFTVPTGPSKEDIDLAA